MKRYIYIEIKGRQITVDLKSLPSWAATQKGETPLKSAVRKAYGKSLWSLLSAFLKAEEKKTKELERRKAEKKTKAQKALHRGLFRAAFKAASSKSFKRDLDFAVKKAKVEVEKDFDKREAAGRKNLSQERWEAIEKAKKAAKRRVAKAYSKRKVAHAFLSKAAPVVRKAAPAVRKAAPTVTSFVMVEGNGRFVKKSFKGFEAAPVARKAAPAAHKAAPTTRKAAPAVRKAAPKVRALKGAGFGVAPVKSKKGFARRLYVEKLSKNPSRGWMADEAFELGLFA